MLEANEIVEGLWQGSYPKPGPQVAQEGFEILVLTAREWQTPADEYPGVEVIHAPNDDHPSYPFTQESLDTAINAGFEVAQAVRNKRKVLVTCAAGLNRSGLVSALALHFLFGWGGPQCMAHVRIRRGLWRTPGVLYNQDFVRALSKVPSRKPRSLIL